MRHIYEHVFLYILSKSCSSLSQCCADLIEELWKNLPTVLLVFWHVKKNSFCLTLYFCSPPDRFDLEHGAEQAGHCMDALELLQVGQGSWGVGCGVVDYAPCQPLCFGVSCVLCLCGAARSPPFPARRARGPSKARRWRISS